MDMGHEYEELTDRYAALTKRVCVANKGQIPSSAPQDPELAAQWRELTIAAGKFAEMMKAEMKTLGDDDADWDGFTSWLEAELAFTFAKEYATFM